jgi:hypothetical protein
MRIEEKRDFLACLFATAQFRKRQCSLIAIRQQANEFI